MPLSQRVIEFRESGWYDFKGAARGPIEKSLPQISTAILQNHYTGKLALAHIDIIYTHTATPLCLGHCSLTE